MLVSARSLALMMECGRLEPYSDVSGIRTLCDTAKQYELGVVFANLAYLPVVVYELRGTPIRPALPIAFPFGATSSAVKAFEARQGLEQGAQEFDMVMSLQRFKSGDDAYVREDIAAVVDAVDGAMVKVILETCYLTKPEIVRASQIAKDAGAKYVKTSTGYGRYCARVVDVQLIRDNVEIGIKAAGDVEDLYTCLAMLKAGATRIGTNPEDAARIIDDFRGQHDEIVELGEASRRSAELRETPAP